jgi:nicotinamidase-related amidase
MTTLGNRPNAALLVVDVQRGVVEGTHQRDAVVANVGSLVDKARREQVPVVWVQHSDRRSTARSSGATTRPWSATPTPPRTRRHGERHRRTR